LAGRRGQPDPSIFNRKPLPDFIDPFFKRIEARVNAPIVKVKYVGRSQKSENPMVRFDVDKRLFNRVTDRNHNVPQHVHRIPLLADLGSNSQMIGSRDQATTRPSRRVALGGASIVGTSNCGSTKKLQRLA
jgi:hypothetical protein